MADLRDLYQEVILEHSKAPRNYRELKGSDRKAEGYADRDRGAVASEHAPQATADMRQQFGRLQQDDRRLHDLGRRRHIAERHDAKVDVERRGKLP